MLWWGVRKHICKLIFHRMKKSCGLELRTCYKIQRKYEYLSSLMVLRAELHICQFSSEENKSDWISQMCTYLFSENILTSLLTFSSSSCMPQEHGNASGKGKCWKKTVSDNIIIFGLKVFICTSVIWYRIQFYTPTPLTHSIPVTFSGPSRTKVSNTLYSTWKEK